MRGRVHCRTHSKDANEVPTQFDDECMCCSDETAKAETVYIVCGALFLMCACALVLCALIALWHARNKNAMTYWMSESITSRLLLYNNIMYIRDNIMFCICIYSRCTLGRAINNNNNNDSLYPMQNTMPLYTVVAITPAYALFYATRFSIISYRLLSVRKLKPQTIPTYTSLKSYIKNKKYKHSTQTNFNHHNTL